MRNIVILIKDDEGVSLSNPILNELKNTFNVLLQNLQLSASNITDELLEQCAGKILEEFIKINIKNISSADLKKHFKFIDDKWYDFKYDNNQVKIITFKEGEYLSSTVLSASQYENRKDMIFVSIIYTIENDSLSIKNVYVTNGNKVKINYDKVLYDSIFKEVQNQEQESEEETELTSLRMIFTSNLLGDVQIVNV